MVQEKAACDRMPVPTRNPQPLSQGLRPCQLPLHRGAKPSGGRRTPCPQPSPAGDEGRETKSQAPRQTRGWGTAEAILCVGERGVPGGISISPQNKFCGVPREFHRFPANELPEIRCRHSPAGVSRPPGGLSVHFPPVESGRFPRKTGFAGAPVDLTASVAAHSGSLRHDGGTRRRSPLCGQTAQALRGLRARRRSAFPRRIKPSCRTKQLSLKGPEILSPQT